MPSPPLLDIDALVAPISPDHPAGESLPFEVRTNLDEFRRIVEGAERPEDNKEADWDKVIELAQATLTGKSKHLRPAARLTEALLRKDHKGKILGYAGLRDGLRLLRRLVEECWERLQPPLEDEDALEYRAADLNWLDDNERGALFPISVQRVPLFGPTPQYSLLDLQSGKTKDAIPPDIDKAIRATKAEDLRLATEDLAEGYKELLQLTQGAAAKMAGAAPGLVKLRSSVEEASTKLKQLLDKYFPGQAAAPAPATGNGQPTAAPASAPAPPPPPAPITRDDCYLQMEKAAALLRELEPHSPVPFLVQRAIDMRDKSFPELIAELMKVDANALKDLNKILGVKADDAKKKPAED